MSFKNYRNPAYIATPENIPTNIAIIFMGKKFRGMLKKNPKDKNWILSESLEGNPFQVDSGLKGDFHKRICDNYGLDPSEISTNISSSGLGYILYCNEKVARKIHQKK